ncbi:MAG: activator of Hsp90 ATPase 1 family protein [Sediminibacterium sp.]|nr:activator of Hsp90 ATPase 1 family protein [Sediminibacterium sp.]
MANEKNNADELIITRELLAPRELVFAAFTNPAHLAKWWGPANFTFGIQTMDVRPGGICHYKMEGSDEFVMWAKFVYIEIIEPEKVVFLNCFSNAEAGLTRFPMMPTWPMEMHNILTLAEENGKTILTLRIRPHHATEEETTTFIEGFGSMQQGFGASFDQLENYLTSL